MSNMRSIVYAYSPRKDDDHNGDGYASMNPGPDGMFVVRTLEDYRTKQTTYVTISTSEKLFGKRFIIPEITYVNSENDEFTLKNVPVYAHDSSYGLRNSMVAHGERVDVPVDRDMTVVQVSKQPFFLEEIEFKDAIEKVSPVSETPKKVSKTPPDFSRGGKDRYNTNIPASIRHNNPGAMYPAKWMEKFGMKGFDIIGGGHKIAYFPDAISGTAANIALLDRLYADLDVDAFIEKWSGGNSSSAYANHVAKALGISRSDTIDHDMIRSEGWKIIKAQSTWESGGKGFKLTDEQWQEAQAKFREVMGYDEIVSEEPETPKNEPETPVKTDGKLPWLETAKSLIGIEEDTSSDSNQTILDWANEVGVESDYSNDSIPWCGLFMAYVMKHNDIDPPDTPLWALSWNSWGKKLSEPAFGCVIVFKRDGGGHVALYLGENDDYYFVLGGNQSDAVNVKAMPKERAVGFRWPDSHENLLKKGRVETTLDVAVSRNEQ